MDCALARLAARLLAERNLWDLALGRVADLEELLRLKAALVGDDRGRPLLDLGVVGLDVRVVDPARGLDLVLQLGELALELLEVLRRAQLRILLRDDPEAAEGLRELGLGLPGLLGAARLHCGRAGLGDVLERRLLVRRVALDRLHEVGHEVVPPLELDVDPAPSLLDAVPRGDDAVADEDVDQAEQEKQPDDHDYDDHAVILYGSLVHSKRITHAPPPQGLPRGPRIRARRGAARATAGFRSAARARPRSEDRQATRSWAAAGRGDTCRSRSGASLPRGGRARCSRGRGGRGRGARRRDPDGCGRRGSRTRR